MHSLKWKTFQQYLKCLSIKLGTVLGCFFQFVFWVKNGFCFHGDNVVKWNLSHLSHVYSKQNISFTFQTHLRPYLHWLDTEAGLVYPIDLVGTALERYHPTFSINTSGRRARGYKQPVCLPAVYGRIWVLL